MISRLTALAAVFAVVTTASLAYAANLKLEQRASAATAPLEVIQLERVVITGKRPSASR